MTAPQQPPPQWLRRECRWSFYCTTEATQAVVVETLGFTVDACSEHAEEHAQWEAAVEEQRNPPDEPLPEEWCPDASLENATPVPHCPRHGTPAARGLADGVPS